MMLIDSGGTALKRFFEKFLPHLSMALSITIAFVVYLDTRNPMMEFLVGTPFYLLCIANLVVSLVMGLQRYILRARDQADKKDKKIQEKS